MFTEAQEQVEPLGSDVTGCGLEGDIGTQSLPLSLHFQAHEVGSFLPHELTSVLKCGGQVTTG